MKKKSLTFQVLLLLLSCLSTIRCFGESNEWYFEISERLLQQEEEEEEEEIEVDPINFQHAILNLVAWGVTVDLGIIVLRLFRGRQWKLFGVQFTAESIHMMLMWTTLILSGVGTGLILNENVVPDTPYLIGEPLDDSHYIMGLIVLFYLFIAVLTGIANFWARKGFVTLKSSFINFRNVHIFLALTGYLVAKATLITGVLLYIEDDGQDWRIPVYIYLFVVLLVQIAVQIIHMYQSRYNNNKATHSRNTSNKPTHIALMEQLNKRVPTETIRANFPKIKWVLIGNKVFDLTGWTHPGGNFIIEAVVGREIGRFFYGNYALENTKMQPHSHSLRALAQLDSLYIGEVTNADSVLVSKTGKIEVTSNHSSVWKLDSISPISKTVSQVNFMSGSIRALSLGTNLSTLGQHFSVNFNRKRTQKRLYTTAFSLTATNQTLRNNIYDYFQKIMTDPSVKYDHVDSHTAPQETLPFFIKKYGYRNAFSTAIHNTEINSSNNEFIIEGPLGRGLELTPETTGTHVIICAGTGVLPFLDFLNLFLMKNIYDLIKKTRGDEAAQAMNVFGLPFDNFMNGMKIKFFGAFPDREETLGIDIICKLAEISKSYSTNNFEAYGKGFIDNNVVELKEHFSLEVFNKYTDLTEDKYYVVGPPKMNLSVPKILESCGISKDKIMLV